MDMHPELGISGVEVIYTRLHAGGKFGNENYAYSGGLHGVGASVVNALSRWMTVDSFRDWTHWAIRFESNYDEKEGKVMAGKAVTPLERLGNTRKRGTLVRFMPDDRIFEDTVFNHDVVRSRLRELAYLNPNVRITLTDERVPESAGRTEEFCYAGGIADYVRWLNREKTPLTDEIIVFSGQKDDIRFSAAVQYTDSYSVSVFSFANNISTGEGGTHEAGFRSAWTRIFNDYARRIGALKEKDNNLSGEDFREGLTTTKTLFP